MSTPDTDPNEIPELPEIPEDQPVTVEIEAGAGEAGAETKPPAEQAEEKPVTDPHEGIEQLKAQIAQRDRDLAEARRQVAEKERIVVAAREQGLSFQEAALQSQVAQAQQEIETLTASFAAAQNAGDYEEAAKVNTKLAQAAARKDRYEATQEAWKQRREHAEQEAQRAPPDPVEATLAQLTPPGAAWLRNHRDLIKPEGGVRDEVLAAHYAARAKGIVNDSPEYFKFVEEHLGLAEPPAAEPPPPPAAKPGAPAQQRRPASVAAPVTRSAPGNGKPTISIKLTPEQRAAAAMSGVSEAEYAKQLHELQQSGQLKAS